MPARMQLVEIGDPSTLSRTLTIDDERGCPIAQRGLNDQGIAVGPVITVSGEQLHALAVELDDQAIAIMCLISWIQSGPAGTLVPRVGRAGPPNVASARLSLMAAFESKVSRSRSLHYLNQCPGIAAR